MYPSQSRCAPWAPADPLPPTAMYDRMSSPSPSPYSPFSLIHSLFSGLYSPFSLIHFSAAPIGLSHSFILFRVTSIVLSHSFIRFPLAAIVLSHSFIFFSVASTVLSHSFILFPVALIILSHSFILFPADPLISLSASLFRIIDSHVTQDITKYIMMATQEIDLWGVCSATVFSCNNMGLFFQVCTVSPAFFLYMLHMQSNRCTNLTAMSVACISQMWLRKWS